MYLHVKNEQLNMILMNRGKSYDELIFPLWILHDHWFLVSVLVRLIQFPSASCQAMAHAYWAWLELKLKQYNSGSNSGFGFSTHPNMRSKLLWVGFFLKPNLFTRYRWDDLLSVPLGLFIYKYASLHAYILYLILEHMHVA